MKPHHKQKNMDNKCDTILKHRMVSEYLTVITFADFHFSEYKKTMILKLITVYMLDLSINIYHSVYLT